MKKAGRMILDKLMQNGLDVRVGLKPYGLKADQSVKKAYLSDGSALDCQCLIGKRRYAMPWILFPR